MSGAPRFHWGHTKTLPRATGRCFLCTCLARPGSTAWSLRDAARAHVWGLQVGTCVRSPGSTTWFDKTHMHFRSGSMCPLTRIALLMIEGTPPASRVRACQHGGAGPSADSTSDLRWRPSTAVCEDVQSQRCVPGHDLANLTHEVLVSQLGVFGTSPAKKILAAPGPRSSSDVWDVRRVHCKCPHQGARGGRQRLQRCAHLRRFQNSVLCRVVPEKRCISACPRLPCVEAYGLRWGRPVVHSLDALAVPSAMKMTRAAVHPTRTPTHRAQATRHAARRRSRQRTESSTWTCTSPRPLRGAEAGVLRARHTHETCAHGARGVCIYGGGVHGRWDHPGGSPLANPCHDTHSQHIRANVNSRKVRFQLCFSHCIIRETWRVVQLSIT